AAPPPADTSCPACAGCPLLPSCVTGAGTPTTTYPFARPCRARRCWLGVRERGGKVAAPSRSVKADPIPPRTNPIDGIEGGCYHLALHCAGKSGWSPAFGRVAGWVWKPVPLPTDEDGFHAPSLDRDAGADAGVGRLLFLRSEGTRGRAARGGPACGN